MGRRGSRAEKGLLWLEPPPQGGWGPLQRKQHPARRLGPLSRGLAQRHSLPETGPITCNFEVEQLGKWQAQRWARRVMQGVCRNKEE